MGLYLGSNQIKVSTASLVKSYADYIIDFGLPVEIDFPYELTDCWIGRPGREKGKYGIVAMSEDKMSIIYTPTKILSGNEKIIVSYKYSGGSNKVYRYKVTIIPASNVLYEENFLTAGDGWTQIGTALNATQSNQLAKADGIYGYDDAYKSSTGDSRVYKVDGLTTISTKTSALTTTFTGTGFDLIGNCGPDTGLVMLRLRNQDPDAIPKSRAVIIDTRYDDGTGNTTLNHVPLAHMTVDYGTYDVEIFASGTELPNTANKMSTYSVNRTSVAYVSAFERYLRENNITDVEYIVMSDVLSASAQSVSAVSVYAAEEIAVEHKPGTHVEIDAFRVYYSTDNDNYNTAEKNVQYVNIDSIGLTSKYITTFEEDNTLTITTDDSLSAEIQDQCKLCPNESIVFDVPNQQQIQISLQCLTETTVTWNTENTLQTNTEMYYILDKYDDMFVITNTSTEGALMVNNLKLKDSVVIPTDEEKIKNNIAMSYCYKNQLMDVNCIGLYDLEGTPLIPKEDSINNE